MAIVLKSLASTATNATAAGADKPSITVGVITFYKAQMGAIAQELERRRIPGVLVAAERGVKPPEGAPPARMLVEVKTVDSFQGQVCAFLSRVLCFML